MGTAEHLVSPWWELGDPQSQLVATVDELRSESASRRLAYRTWDDIYEGNFLYVADNALGLEAMGRWSSLDMGVLNFTRSAVNHVHAKITSEIPTCRAGSHGGRANDRRRAKHLSQFLAGAHDQLDLEGVSSRSALTGLRTGTGATKVVVRNGQIVVEAIHPRELFVDIDDARHGRPRVLYHIAPVDRRALAIEFPDMAEGVLTLPTTEDTEVVVYDPFHAGAQVSDAVDRYEAWVLPEGDEPGRHVVCSATELLLDEEWDCPRFPISLFLPWESRVGSTIFGMGLVQVLDRTQKRIDDAVSHISESILHNNLKIFISDDADVSPDVIADPTVGTIIKVKGGVQPPEFRTPEAASQQEIAWLEKLIEWLYQLAGMSQSVAQSQAPAGMTSGRAQLLYHAFAAQTHVDMMRRLGRHVQDVMERILDAAHTLSEDDPSWTVRYAKGSIVRQIDWTDVQMDRDEYVVELEEVSPVADTFAGRMQQLEEDAAEGRISPEFFAQLRQDPDLWASRFQVGQANSEYVDDLIDRLLDPDGPMPLLIDEAPRELLMDALRTEILCAMVNDDDPAVIQRLQRFASMLAQDIEQAAQESQAQQSLAAPASPGGGVVMPTGQQVLGGSGGGGG